MTAITFGATTATISAKAPAAARTPGILARVYTAFVEARMRQAEREIALHRHLLPGQLQAVGERLAPRTEKDLPFAR